MKPEASSGGGGGDRPRYSSSHYHTNSNSSHINKEKVRCSSSSSSLTTSVYRSLSEPGFHMHEQSERHRESERVVVKAYGNAAPPSPQNLGLLSPSQVMPIAGILEPGRDVSGSSSGRKRPGRKTRRPDAYGGLSPENGFSSSFQIGRFPCTPSAFQVAWSSSHGYFCTFEENLKRKISLRAWLFSSQAWLIDSRTLLGFPLRLSLGVCC